MEPLNDKLKKLLADVVIKFCQTHALYREELKIHGTIVVTTDCSSIFVTQLFERHQRQEVEPASSTADVKHNEGSGALCSETHKSNCSTHGGSDLIPPAGAAPQWHMRTPQLHGSSRRKGPVQGTSARDFNNWNNRRQSAPTVLSGSKGVNRVVPSRYLQWPTQSVGETAIICDSDDDGSLWASDGTRGSEGSKSYWYKPGETVFPGYERRLGNRAAGRMNGPNSSERDVISRSSCRRQSSREKDTLQYSSMPNPKDNRETQNVNHDNPNDSCQMIVITDNNHEYQRDRVSHDTGEVKGHSAPGQYVNTTPCSTANVVGANDPAEEQCEFLLEPVTDIKQEMLTDSVQNQHLNICSEENPADQDMAANLETENNNQEISPRSDSQQPCSVSQPRLNVSSSAAAKSVPCDPNNLPTLFIKQEPSENVMDTTGANTFAKPTSKSPVTTSQENATVTAVRHWLSMATPSASLPQMSAYPASSVDLIVGIDGAKGGTCANLRMPGRVNESPRSVALSSTRRHKAVAKSSTGFGLYKCPYCVKSYRFSISLKRHIETRHLGRRYKCKHCDNMFDSIAGLSSHTRIKHHQMMRFECNVCGMRFNTSSAMGQHVTRLHGILPT